MVECSGIDPWLNRLSCRFIGGREQTHEQQTFSWLCLRGIDSSPPARIAPGRDSIRSINSYHISQLVIESFNFSFLHP